MVTEEPGKYMCPGTAARVLKVHPVTLVRWHARGKLEADRAPNGHRRYLTASVMKLRAEREGGTQ